jgi:hypothetical protein
MLNEAALPPSCSPTDPSLMNRDCEIPIAVVQVYSSS